MKISKQGLDLIKGFESFVPNPYTDAVGLLTIGYGSTYYPNGSRVKMTDESITEQEASRMLFVVFENDFADYIPNNVNQNQFDALGSLIYNIGASAFLKSTLYRKVSKNPNDKSIEQEFLKWNKGRVSGKLIELKGLTNRRKKEVELYFKPV